MVKVCFVCLGNICRSPMAEFVMKDLAKDSNVTVVSRATSSWEHGNPIHSGTQNILRQYELPFDHSKTSQQFQFSDFEEYDVVIGMDENNVKDLQHLSSGKYDNKIFLFRDGGVPDPWYTGDFEETYDLVTEGCKQWLSRIEEEMKDV